MKKRIGSFVVAFGLLAICSPVFAHHGTGLVLREGSDHIEGDGY